MPTNRYDQSIVKQEQTKINNSNEWPSVHVTIITHFYFNLCLIYSKEKLFRSWESLNFSFLRIYILLPLSPNNQVTVKSLVCVSFFVCTAYIFVYTWTFFFLCSDFKEKGLQFYTFFFRFFQNSHYQNTIDWYLVSDIQIEIDWHGLNAEFSPCSSKVP